MSPRRGRTGFGSYLPEQPKQPGMLERILGGAMGGALNRLIGLPLDLMSQDRQQENLLARQKQAQGAAQEQQRQQQEAIAGRRQAEQERGIQAGQEEEAFQRTSRVDPLRALSQRLAPQIGKEREALGQERAQIPGGVGPLQTPTPATQQVSGFKDWYTGLRGPEREIFKKPVPSRTPGLSFEQREQLIGQKGRQKAKAASIKARQRGEEQFRGQLGRSELAKQRASQAGIPQRFEDVPAYEPQFPRPGGRPGGPPVRVPEQIFNSKEEIVQEYMNRGASRTDAQQAADIMWRKMGK